MNDLARVFNLLQRDPLPSGVLFPFILITEDKPLHARRRKSDGPILSGVFGVHLPGPWPVGPYLRDLLAHLARSLF